MIGDGSTGIVQDVDQNMIEQFTGQKVERACGVVA
jgi:hypothetical protein